MKRFMIVVASAMVLFAVVSLAQAPQKSPEVTPEAVAPQATDQQIQNAIQELSNQVRGQAAIRDKAAKDLQDSMNSIDRLIAQIQQLQGELKKRQGAQKPKEAPPPVKK